MVAVPLETARQRQRYLSESGQVSEPSGLETTRRTRHGVCRPPPNASEPERRVPAQSRQAVPQRNERPATGEPVTHAWTSEAADEDGESGYMCPNLRPVVVR